MLNLARQIAAQISKSATKGRISKKTVTTGRCPLHRVIPVNSFLRRNRLYRAARFPG